MLLSLIFSILCWITTFGRIWAGYQPLKDHKPNTTNLTNQEEKDNTQPDKIKNELFKDKKNTNSMK